MRMFRLLPDFRQFIYIFFFQRYSKFHISGFLFNMHSHAYKLQFDSNFQGLQNYVINMKNYTKYLTACNRKMDIVIESLLENLLQENGHFHRVFVGKPVTGEWTLSSEYLWENLLQEMDIVIESLLENLL